MASQQAEKLKEKFDTSTAEECEPLTFGDLEEGDQFICFPLPGDNSGHGGFKKGSYLFTKESMEVTNTSTSVTSGNGIRNVDKNISSFPLSMIVLKVMCRN